MQDLILSFLTNNPSAMTGIIVWLITTEILPFVPSQYNGVIQSVITAISNYLASKK